MFRITLVILILMPFISSAQKADIQGHRGARGMMPENTIPAFKYALDHGVTTLELDVVITKDKQVVVSHEPWMSPEICLTPEGAEFKDDKKYNIYAMTYEEVKGFDCGYLNSTRFPQQQKLHVSKPLLSDVIKEVEKHIKSYTQYEVDYNIEIKSSREGDSKFHPEIEEFSDLVYQTIDQYLPMNRIVIQSFDFRVLQYWHEKYPQVRLAALVENTRSIRTNLANVGFKPYIYSPYFKLLSKSKVKELHNLGIKVIPWTVNKENEMKELLGWGIDGIITDYPNIASELGLTLPLKETSGKK
ncbi:glycerophosphodiester phosphodiesterase [Fulvivirga sp. 29W222]|uniref:Glycerophosphodiester phosphodiesterase n=1 Tax=Fulvivirga marina TaxID=2494733 RepID=A0A937KDS1_9BACT|nr:glycerophosphodiester phosphodiesterase [Fulvivirga marina]MBL6446360.1 glycerophosphodiester phosphodiesterase [Fulvivirga marina]